MFTLLGTSWNDGYQVNQNNYPMSIRTITLCHPERSEGSEMLDSSASLRMTRGGTPQNDKGRHASE